MPHELSKIRRCNLLNMPRSTAYYQPQGVSDDDLKIMRRLDELHLKFPYKGSRTLRDALWDEYGIHINRKRVQRLMRLMGICSIAPQKKTTLPNKAHKVYPYLLRDLTIDRPNQVWCTDITYIPMRQGFVYLVAIMDWYSRKVLSWRLSNSMHPDFCVAALEEALELYGPPDIFNSDQGSQFTSTEFTNVLKQNHIKISMDGKGRWMDNVFIERLWRTLKYEEVYLHAYESIKVAKQRITSWFDGYNHKRRHSSLDRRTPDQVYYNLPSNLPKAA